MSERKDTRHSYGNIWDDYVTDSFPRIRDSQPYSEQNLEAWRVLNRTDRSYAWPGDEWGDQQATEVEFDSTLSGIGDVSLACELGAGSGRYTRLALSRFSSSRIVSFDVSQQFELQIRQRLSDYISSGRLETVLLNGRPEQMFRHMQANDDVGCVDLVYSFDAMVHVDLHTLLIYWITSAMVLKQGGHLAMNVADATSENGTRKLIANAKSVYARNGNAGSHFMWLSPDIVRSVLERLGFDVSFRPGNGRDCSFCARLIDREKGKSWVETAGAKWPFF